MPLFSVSFVGLFLYMGKETYCILYDIPICICGKDMRRILLDC